MTTPQQSFPPIHADPLKPVPEPVREATDLDRSLVRGLGWTAAAKWLSQILTWPATLIVARILTPDDFGILAMAAMFMGLVALVNEFGLGSAVIRHRELTHHQIAQISGLCVLFGGAATLVGLAAAYPLATFYHTPSLKWVVFALSANFLITGFKTIPLSLMQRDLQFRESATNEALGAIAQSLTLVIFAFLGLKYWSLVLSSLLGSALTTILAYWQRPHALARPRRGEIGEAVTFGSHFMGSRLAWYLYTNADFFVIGRVLGKTALGNYSFGWEFATLPVEKVTSLIGRVSPPIFSAVQNDLPALRRYLSRLAGGIALLTFPAGVGLAIVAHDFVLVALGDKWVAAIVPLQILAVYAAFRSIMPLIAQVGYVVGLNRYIMHNAIASAVVLPCAFFVGARWGTTGVALAWVAAYPLVALPMGATVFKRIGMSVREFGSAVWPALSSAAVLVPVVLLTQAGIGGRFAAPVRLTVEVLAGAVAYALTVWGVHADAVRSMLDVFPRFQKKPASL